MMLRSRRSALSGIAASASASSSSLQSDDDDDDNDNKISSGSSRDKRQIHRRIYRHRKRILLGFLIYLLFSSIRFYRILVRNMTVIHQSNNENDNSLRSGSNNNNDNNHQCPALPSRLHDYVHKDATTPFETLSAGDVQLQLPTMVAPKHNGTTGNRILVCPSQQIKYRPCTGVVKVYKYPSVYFHVKHCLTILKHTGIVPRIMYADDETHTLVEEDLGRITMLNQKIPTDFDIQLRRIRCILQKHHIIHRDLTWRNFIINMDSGFVYVIDFGDAFLWKGDGDDDGKNGNNNNNNNNVDNDSDYDYYSWRNLINLFNMWWMNYDEGRRLEQLIADTKPYLVGERIWKPEHRWTTMNQNRVGALLLTQQMFMDNIPGSEKH